MSAKKYSALLLFVLTILFCNSVVCFADWPMWGADSQRSFSVDATIPENLQLRWVKELGKP